MPPVISFRPTPEEADEIEKTRRIHGFKTRAEAARYLIRQGARQSLSWKDDPLFQFQVEDDKKTKQDVTSKEINRELYGWD